MFKTNATENVKQEAVVVYHFCKPFVKDRASTLCHFSGLWKPALWAESGMSVFRCTNLTLGVSFYSAPFLRNASKCKDKRKHKKKKLKFLLVLALMLMLASGLFSRWNERSCACACACVCTCIATETRIYWFLFLTRRNHSVPRWKPLLFLILRSLQ